MALAGVAAFVALAVFAPDAGGIVGRLTSDALAVVLGRLALLAPIALLAAAAVLAFELRPRWLSGWFAGLLLLLFGLVLIWAAGFTPFGMSHEADTFVLEVYRERSGWIGEAFYAGLSRLVGLAGVTILGWFCLLAGLILATRVSVKRLITDSRRVTERMTSQSQQIRRETATRSTAEPRGPLDDPYLSGFGPQPSESVPDAISDLIWDEPTVIRARGRFLDGASEYPELFRAATYVEGTAGTVVTSPGRAEGTPYSPTEKRASELGEGPMSEAGAAVAGGPLRAYAQQAHLPGMGAGEILGPEAREPDRPRYILPGTEFLKKSVLSPQVEPRGDKETAVVLVETLASFGVDTNVVGMVVGPRVTRYELQVAPGTKVSKVSSLKDDLAYALATTDIRILAPIPGKSAVGVEVPNRRPSFVTLGDIYRDFPRGAGPLMTWLGKDISGKPVYADLTKMPHLLIAGTTGSGKSGCVNCIISSILLRSSPEQVRMILVDPKKVELSYYERIPHLLVPVVTNMKNAAGVLHNVVKEMDERYELMDLERARHLDEMNQARARRSERPLPYILIVVDELADLMMVAPAEVEDHIIRLAQKARAVGIHLVVATQRPSVDVITGMIKANIPSRIAFAVTSQIDSRVILDVNGAESLLGMGDMLFKPLGSSRLQRVQGAFITEEEIQRLVDHCRRQAEPEFREELLETHEGEHAGDEFCDPDRDELLVEAAELVLETGSASVSMLQRRLRVGYTRAGRLIDMLERRGIVGPYEGSKPRQILVRLEERGTVLDALRAENVPPMQPLEGLEP